MTTTLTPRPSTPLTHPTALRRPARRATAIGLEVVVMGAVFVAYRQVRHLTSGDTDAAFANADHVVAIEQRLGVFTERSVQRLALHSEQVVGFLNHYYVGVHFPATIAVLLWACWRHPAAYRRVRAAFLGVTLAALAIHVAIPLAPPRMLDGRGFVDTLAVYGPRIYPADTTQSVANQFAAMPSLHFGWAVLVAAAVITILRTSWRWLAVLHPAVTLLAIVATANHYWLDAAVAGVLVVLAGLLIRAWARRATAPAGTAIAMPARTGAEVAAEQFGAAA
ncbi:MAG TPA: phosphatase PAP2 family protein [Ilumatobacteraceae bacterium]|nr:phosphatase PAP2 family protein [Ilumatobacteraceae bacterium]